MTTTAAAPTGRATGDRTLRRWPLWTSVLVGWTLSRVVTTAVFWEVARTAVSQSRIGTAAGVVKAMAAWDGQWYQFIAMHGYPAHLPAPVNGVPQTSAWAFLPLYPWLVRLLTLGSATLWPVAAEAVSVAFGGAAAVVLAQLLLPHVGRRTAFRTSLLFVCSPMGFVLQIAYADAMGLFLVFVALLLVDRRRPFAAAPVLALLAFTRPGVEALTLLVGIVVVARLVRARQNRTRVPRRESLGWGTLLAVGVAASAAWPVLAGAVTGVPDAYVRTELAWRAAWTGRTPFIPFAQWAWAADFWFGARGPLVLGLLTIGLVLLLLSRAAKRLGPTVRWWLVAWPLYLGAVFFPQSSVFRLAMPMAPGAATFVGRLPRWAFAMLVLGCLVAQAWWVHALYGGWQRYWAVP